MYVVDQNSNNSLHDVIIYLTIDEARELHDDLEDLIKKPNGGHSHISNSDFTKEITICIYNKDHLDGFDDRSRKLIQGDQL